MGKIKPIRQKLAKVSHSVRAAQAILQYGVGAMVDFPDQTLMTAAPEFWVDNKRNLRHIHDERLERQLGVNFLGIPFDGGVSDSEGMAFVRFPQWYFCPKCRRFEPLGFWYQEFKTKVTGQRREKDLYMNKPVCLKCSNKGLELVPARIIVACAAGHIDDFPWIEWVHARSQKECCHDPHLLFKTGANSSAGLEGLTIECQTCKAKANLERSFNKDGLAQVISNFHCSGNMPWKHEKEQCSLIPQAKQRGASVIYYPKVDSSLVIPPYSGRLRSLIRNSQTFDDFRKLIKDNETYSPGMSEDFITKRLKEMTKTLSNEIGLDSDSIASLFRNMILSDGEATLLDNSEEVYRQAEYQALDGSIPQLGETGDFLREEINGAEYDIPGIKQVALLHKIREVRALIGFTRLEPPSSGILGVPMMDEARFQCIKQPDTDWYPGYEVRGEGIFIQFSNDTITEWVKRNDHAQSQIYKIKKNAKLAGKELGNKASAKFIFLHTLAHLIIQQMSFESGYNSAALRERIYCDADHPEFPMCGLFIYTACGDSEGTLGGLVRQGRPDKMTNIFRTALERAMWCSNDPICSESGGQGRNALNLAACHSCALLPETSCEEFNVLLDRTLLVGSSLHRENGFFTTWLSGDRKGV
jgi:hypothetical protein